MQNAEPDDGKERYPITSVDNALRLLLLFRDQPMVRIADAAEHLDVARSTAHRLVRMLAFHGFVRQDPATRAYVPGSALIDVGLSVVSRIDIRGAARAEMEELARATGETVHLARLELPNVLFIDCVESSKAMRVVSRVGQAMPAHCTSVGKAMLVHVDGVLDGYYKDQRLPTLTPSSISSRAKLDQALKVVRRQGYATSSEESEDGVGSVGVAILDRPGRLLGGLSIAAPTARMAPDVTARFAAEMKRAAEAIGFALG